LFVLLSFTFDRKHKIQCRKALKKMADVHNSESSPSFLGFGQSTPPPPPFNSFVHIIYNQWAWGLTPTMNSDDSIKILARILHLE
jgi:hypothetical protein